MRSDMSNIWLERWNERYSSTEYAYGTDPNEFFKKELPGLPAGKILFAAEGEGRNAVFAAVNEWEVAAFDISEEGKKKAVKLAETRGVSIDYRIGELPALNFRENTFDAIALIYAHFPVEIRSEYHRILDTLLKQGGYILFEAFSKNHLPYRLENEKVGGPSDLSNLFSIEEIMADFAGYHFIRIEETVIELNEGLYHQGTGSVIRFLAQKIENHYA